MCETPGLPVQEQLQGAKVPWLDCSESGLCLEHCWPRGTVYVHVMRFTGSCVFMPWLAFALKTGGPE